MEISSLPNLIYGNIWLWATQASELAHVQRTYPSYLLTSLPWPQKTLTPGTGSEPQNTTSPITQKEALLMKLAKACQKHSMSISPLLLDTIFFAH